MASSVTSALSDRYRIESEIGSGGMATVYLAQDLKHDRRVAVKVLKPELAAVSTSGTARASSGSASLAIRMILLRSPNSTCKATP